MKPAAQPIDPTKRSDAPPPVVLTREIAGTTMRVFLAMLVVPLMFEISAWVSPSKNNMLVLGVRSVTQWLLTNGLNEGNRDVFLGRDGRLFDQAELARIIDVERTNAPASAELTAFAAELKKRDIPLLLVAVPERVTIYPGTMRGSKYRDAVRSAGEVARLEALRQTGIEFIDLTGTFWDLRGQKGVFFAQDSHWTPDAMKTTALLVEKHIREKHPGLALDETPLIRATILTPRDAGDLSRKLDPLLPQIQLGEEEADMVSFPGTEMTGESPILLIGTDLIRVFDDKALGFGGDSNAGFTTQPGLLMGRPIEVADWPDSSPALLEGKKLVVLVLSMSEVLP